MYLKRMVLIQPQVIVERKTSGRKKLEHRVVAGRQNAHKYNSTNKCNMHSLKRG